MTSRSQPRRDASSNKTPPAAAASPSIAHDCAVTPRQARASTAAAGSAGAVPALPMQSTLTRLARLRNGAASAIARAAGALSFQPIAIQSPTDAGGCGGTSRTGRPLLNRIASTNICASMSSADWGRAQTTRSNRRPRRATTSLTSPTTSRQLIDGPASRGDSARATAAPRRSNKALARSDCSAASRAAASMMSCISVPEAASPIYGTIVFGSGRG